LRDEERFVGLLLIYRRVKTGLHWNERFSKEVHMRALSLLPLAAVLALPVVAAAREEVGDRSQTTFTGCLQSTPEEDIYVLKTPASDVEIRGISQLKDHLGHRVTVTGSWMEGRSDASGKQKASTQDRDRHLAVTSVRQVSATCESQ
jgi:hypothetical protein